MRGYGLTDDANTIIAGGYTIRMHHAMLSRANLLNEKLYHKC